MINKKVFNQALLNGDNQLVYTHNLNTTSVIPTVYDNTGRQFNTSDLFALGDASGNDKPNIITLSLNSVIAGDWTLLLEYQSTAESTSGRRAFELEQNNDPDTALRVILGKQDTPSVNITLANFLVWLLTKLGFLKVASNLGDLNNVETARSNLGVYSTDQIDRALAGSASLYQSASGSVLGVNNTAVYTPSANYNPSTKKYTDENGGGRIISGSIHIGDISGGGEVKTITIGATLANNSYKIFMELYDASGFVGYCTTKAKTTTTFDVSIHVESSSGVQDFYLYWEIKTL